MSLDIYMIGLIVQDMSKSLEFYRRLGVAIPEGAETRTHVQIKMGAMTFFLDCKPELWDPEMVRKPASPTSSSYNSVLEFYLKSSDAVDAKYAELTGYGYQGVRAPYNNNFGMRFALINDPDGNTLLLSGDL